MYLPNNIVSKYIQKTELNGEINKTTNMAGHFNICLSVTDRTSHKKIEEDIEDLSDASHKLDIYTKHWTKDSGICMLFMYMYKFQRIAT